MSLLLLIMKLSYKIYCMMHYFFSQVFVVGVGSGVDKIELNQIATDPDATHVLTVTDFSQLSKITAQLNNQTCAGVLY